MAAGGIPALLSLLPSRMAAAQQAAVCVLYMAANASVAARAAVCAAGGVQALVQLLKSSSTVRPEALEGAGAVLMALCLEGGPDPTGPFLEAGGAPALVSLLGHGSEAAQGGAPRAIASFAALGHLVGQQALVAAGAVQPLVSCLLRGRGAWPLAWAAIALAQLVRREGGAQVATEAAEAGALQRLLQLLDSSDGSQQFCEPAAMALANICIGLAEQQQQEPYAAVKRELVAAGAAATARLIRRQGSPSVQKAAAALAWFLACGSEAASAELVAAGLVPPLLQLLRAGDEDLGCTAALALRHLAAQSAEAAAAVEAAGPSNPGLGRQLSEGVYQAACCFLL